MGAIDVSFLLSDPDFACEFHVIARNAEVNGYGENVMAESPPEALIGVVQPASDDDLKRVPEALIGETWIKVYAQRPFTADRVGQYADLVIWKGERYQVKQVRDYSAWGAGWVRATCMREAPHA